LLKSDDFLGKTHLSLHKLKNNQTETFTLKLLGVKNGEVNFQVTAQDFDKITEAWFEISLGLEDPYDVVCEKLKDSAYQNSMSETMIETVAFSLSNVDALKKNYLSTNWAETIELQKQLISNSSLVKLTQDEIIQVLVDEDEETPEISESSEQDLLELEKKQTL
jgi:hypothetical protein